MVQLISSIFLWWFLLGFVFISAQPTPKTKCGAIIVIILGGPAAWAYTLIRWIDLEPWKKSI